MPRGRPRPRQGWGPGRGPGPAVTFRWLLKERPGAAVLESMGGRGVTFGGEGAPPGPKSSPLPHPGQGPFICGVETDSRAEATTPAQTKRLLAKQRTGPQRRPGSHTRTPPHPSPPRLEPGLPTPTPSVPAQGVRTRRGEPLTS